MINKPLVSIIMPVYNAAQYVGDALKSITNGTYKNIEIICINDGSTDNSLKVLRDAAGLDPRIKVFNQENCGIVKTLNKAIDLANGDYIARMDADDICEPDRIELQLKLAIHSSADIISSSRKTFGSKTVLHETPTSHEEIIISLAIQNTITHPTVFCKQEVLKNNKYSENHQYAEDYELWTRLAQNGYKFAGIKKSLLNYRLHANQVSKIHQKKQQEIDTEIKINHIKWLSININSIDKSTSKGVIFLESYKLYKRLDRKSLNLNYNAFHMLAKFYCQDLKNLNDKVIRFTVMLASFSAFKLSSITSFQSGAE
jgi:glycosyltransferase involved in cell wall biosynthesis